MCFNELFLVKKFFVCVCGDSSRQIECFITAYLLQVTSAIFVALRLHNRKRHCVINFLLSYFVSHRIVVFFFLLWNKERNLKLCRATIKCDVIAHGGGSWISRKIELNSMNLVSSIDISADYCNHFSIAVDARQHVFTLTLVLAAARSRGWKSKFFSLDLTQLINVLR